MAGEIFNPNPVVFSPAKASGKYSDLLAQSLWLRDSFEESDGEDDGIEEIDQDEIFGEYNAHHAPEKGLHSDIDLIRAIYDPEHPNTLEELRVVSAPQISVASNHVKVEFTPTVPHCGMSTLIGKLSILSIFFI